MVRIRIYTTRCPHCHGLIDQQRDFPRTKGLPHYRCFHCGKIFKTGWKIQPCTAPEPAVAKSALKCWILSIAGILLPLTVSSNADFEISGVFGSILGVILEIASIVAFAYCSYILWRYRFPKYPGKDFYLKIKEEDPELYWLNYREIIRVFPELSEDQPENLDN